MLQAILATDTPLLVTDMALWLRTHALRSPVNISNLLAYLPSDVLHLTPPGARLKGQISHIRSVRTLKEEPVQACILLLLALTGRIGQISHARVLLLARLVANARPGLPRSLNT